jgi:hypothetical protein
MANHEALGARIKRAMQTFAAKNGGTTSPAEFGKAIAKAQGIPNPHTADVIFGWMNGRNTPSLAALMAIGKLAEYETPAQLGTLAYGDEYTIHALDERDYDRFHQRGGLSVGTFSV